MCGFFGEHLIKENALTSKFVFDQISELGFSRGPDQQGYYSNQKNLQLGFNRLAILDLTEQANQPYHSPSGRFSLLFNGEIYNHFHLRTRFLSHHTFHGNSDTETLAVAFDEWPFQQVIEFLDGMFAIYLYDHWEEKSLLARDFAGIKPLFYGLKDGYLVIASQLNQVCRHPVFRASQVDPSSLKLYLEQHFLPAPSGLYENTHQVKPGEIIEISKDGRVNNYVYWDLADLQDPVINSESEAIEWLTGHLDDAVQQEMLADVPLGTFISGGVDSPLVSKLAQDHFDQNLQTFTIGSDSLKHDESEDARAFAQAISADFNLYRMNSREASRVFNEVMQSATEPFADFSIIPTYLVSRLARTKVKVALSGDGGDELFYGYERFWSLLKNLPYRKIPAGLRYWAYGLDKVLTKNRNINSALMASCFGKAHQGLHSRFPYNHLDHIFPDLKTQSLPRDFDVYHYQDEGDELAMLKKMQRAEFYGMMQKTLRKVDQASMGNSLEVRVPFLKKSFIEAALKVSPYLSYGPNQRKTILKKLLTQQIPSVNLQATKKGFSIPLSKWIKEELKPHFREGLLDNPYLKDFGIEKPQLETLLNKHIKGDGDFKWPLFTTYSLLNYNTG